MTTERIDWVEIIEPRSRKHMYANLTTGECVWDRPAGQKVKKTDSHNQWWELFDTNTSRFYYYNASSQQTVWQRPEKCDIIPLAKLQTLKQNTEVRDEDTGKMKKRDSGSGQSVDRNSILALAAAAGSVNGTSRKEHNRSERSSQGGSVRKLSSQTQTTPQSSPKDTGKRHPTHHHHHGHGHKCPHHAALKASNSQGSTEVNKRNPVPVQRQQTLGPQTRHPLTRDQSFQFHQEDVNGFHHCHLHPPLPFPNDFNPRTPSPRSSTLAAFPEPHSHPAFQKGLYDNHSAFDQESLDGQENSRMPNSSSFARISPQAAAPRRQRSFDHKNAFLDSNKDLHRMLNASIPSGIRSVESTPRIQRRNVANDPPLPLIDERNPAFPFPTRPQQDAFTISGGTPMQSRKRRSFPKNAMNPPPSPHNQNQSVQSLSNNGTMASGSSSQSYSSLESKRSYNGSNSSSTVVSSQHSIPVFANQQLSNGGIGLRHENLVPLSPSQWNSPNAIKPGNVTFMKAISPQDGGQVRRTISIDRGDLKSPSSEASSGGKMSTFSPQLPRNTSIKPVINQPSLARTDEDQKAEELLREAEKFVPHTLGENGMRNGSVQRGSSSYGSRRFVKPSEPSHSPDRTSSSGSENDADVEDSDDFEEDSDDENDDCLGEMDGNNRYGHLSPSQLRQHPNYCVLDRSFRGRGPELPVNTANASSEEEDTIVVPPPRERNERVHHPVDTRHASLRRNFGHPVPGPKLPGLEKSQSMQTELSAQQQQPRPLSIILPTQSEASLVSSTKSSSPVGRPYYPDYNGSTTLTREKPNTDSGNDPSRPGQLKLNDHTKGLFRKRVSISSLLSWSKDSIQKPLIMTADKEAKKEACQMFRLVQMYMGDRKTKDNKSQDEIALELTRFGWQKATLRDELFIQICKQTTDNKKPESLRRGWELMAICLAFFPPSPSFAPFLSTYISRHHSPSCDTSEVQVTHYATHCSKRLERMSHCGAKRGIRKPTIEEIQQARVQIFHPSMFGNTLEDVMTLQKERFPDRRLPWIQTTLSEEILRLNGAQTEGIFRVPGDIDEVNMLKVRMDRWNMPDCSDPHIPSSLLKLWYRELYEPLIPARFYDLCIQNCSNPAAACEIVERLPEINRRVLTYLIRFLQIFAQAESTTHVTKMDASNLAMVMAPNCLRCTSDDPAVIFENTRKEMAFMRTLVQNLDTDWIQDVR